MRSPHVQVTTQASSDSLYHGTDVLMPSATVALEAAGVLCSTLPCDEDIRLAIGVLCDSKRKRFV